MSQNLKGKISFRVTSDEVQLVEHICKNAKISRSELLRSAFRQYYLNHEHIKFSKPLENVR